jgi:hypothetical protein
MVEVKEFNTGNLNLQFGTYEYIVYRKTRSIHNLFKLQTIVAIESTLHQDLLLSGLSVHEEKMRDPRKEGNMSSIESYQKRTSPQGDGLPMARDKERILVVMHE